MTIEQRKLKGMVDNSLRRRMASEATSERPLIEMDMEDGASYERERIMLLLHEEIPGLEARAAHDGGPSLKTLIEELIQKIRRVEVPCDCFIPALEGAGQHSPSCAIFKKPDPRRGCVDFGHKGPMETANGQTAIRCGNCGELVG